MTEKLNVICLISGGKDSLFSLLHVVANGHNIVALANVYPDPDIPAEDEDDANSYMYQTVGHTIIPIYADALEIPLYRQKLVGTAVDMNKSYEAPLTQNSAVDDETESLSLLLQKVKEAHPEANALSSGAILSDYQRTRVESVAIRQGLVPLAYLWQYTRIPPYTQTALLDDMTSAGCDSRIIKVASGGLDDSFLWQNVAEPKTKTRLAAAMERFGGVEDGAILGEGGEYETLAMDGPATLWKKRILIEERDREVASEGGDTAFLRFKTVCLVEKSRDVSGYAGSTIPRIPDLFDEVFLGPLHSSETMDLNDISLKPYDKPPATSLSLEHLHEVALFGEDTQLIANLTASPAQYSTAQSQMTSITEILESRLTQASKAHGKLLSVNDITFVSLLLRDMSDFEGINEVYKQIFKKSNPPARVTVACGSLLPDGIKVSASFTLTSTPRNRREGLHVQSRSYWAPANIGPYSQAISVPLDPQASGDTESFLVYIAGQIPLIPASMILPEESPTHDFSKMTVFCRQAVLALQNLWRIGRRMKVQWWTGGIAYIIESEDIQKQSLIAGKIWDQIHERPIEKEAVEDGGDESENVDIWNLRYGHGHSTSLMKTDNRNFPDHGIVEYYNNLSGTTSPPFLAVEIAQLPRGSAIEWQSMGIMHAHVCLERAPGASDSWESVSTIMGKVTVETISVFEPCTDATLHDVMARVQDTRSKYGATNVQSTVYTSRFEEQICQNLEGQIIPCRSLWGRDGRKVALAIISRVSEVDKAG
ncbi:MAG: hypothetical protein M1834_006360 [Cirrosporium novae-zelandiae]|nr:MAG: hypothetical protein M1834_006360 [Cirrosporium novae-zelandiae]